MQDKLHVFTAELRQANYAAVLRLYKLRYLLSVKRHPEEHRKLVALLLLVGVIFLQNLYGLAVSDAIASLAGEVARRLPLYTERGQHRLITCSAMPQQLLTSGWLTASHCLNINVKQLSTLCRDFNGQWREAMTSIVQAGIAHDP